MAGNGYPVVQYCQCLLQTITCPPKPYRACVCNVNASPFVNRVATATAIEQGKFTVPQTCFRICQSQSRVGLGETMDAVQVLAYRRKRSSACSIWWDDGDSVFDYMAYSESLWHLPPHIVRYIYSAGSIPTPKIRETILFSYFKARESNLRHEYIIYIIPPSTVRNRFFSYESWLAIFGNDPALVRWLAFLPLTMRYLSNIRSWSWMIRPQVFVALISRYA